MDNQMYSSLPLLMGAGGNADQRRATDFAGTDARRECPSGSAATTPPTPRCPSTAAIPTAALPKSTSTASICLRLTASATRALSWTAIGMDCDRPVPGADLRLLRAICRPGRAELLHQAGRQRSGTARVYEYIRNTVADAWPFSQQGSYGDRRRSQPGKPASFGSGDVQLLCCPAASSPLRS